MRKGFIIAFPTDTIYGIGTRYDDKKGIKKINKLKKRKHNQRLAVLCNSIEMIEEIALVDDDSRKLIKAFMPGAFTLILKSSKEYMRRTKEDTVGVRIPNLDMAITVINKFGPLKTTSINIHDEPPINDYREIINKFGDYIDVTYKGVIDSNLVASTVVDFTKTPYSIIREGEVTKGEIDKILSK